MNTYTGGANAERRAIRAHVKRVRTRLYKRGAAESVLDLWDELLAWLNARDERYNKKPRGVGR